MKKIWLTSLGASEDLVKKLISQMKTYGLEVNGHFWKDDLMGFTMLLLLRLKNIRTLFGPFWRKINKEFF